MSRNRLVCFRASDEEYRRLRSACEIVGARSISDLARTAVAQLIGPHSGPADEQLLQRVIDLERLVQILWMQLEEAIIIERRSRPPAVSERGGGHSRDEQPGSVAGAVAADVRRP